MTSKNSVSWPSGDCRPVLAVKLSIDELGERNHFASFRDRDDLDWFVGAVINSNEIGSILLMKHDNNPLHLAVFYVDAGIDIGWAQQVISVMFRLSKNEINWALGSP